MGAASARTFDPGASIGRVRDHTIQIRKCISRRIVLRSILMLRTTFHMLRTVMLPTFNKRCCERVASMLRTRLRATSNIRSLSSLLPSCCDHVAIILRPYCDPCCVQHLTLGSLLLNTNLNIRCLQHRKLNIHNIKT
jgi:hypothetical protein